MGCDYRKCTTECRRDHLALITIILAYQLHTLQHQEVEGEVEIVPVAQTFGELLHHFQSLKLLNFWINAAVVCGGWLSKGIQRKWWEKTHLEGIGSWIRYVIGL